MKNLDTTNIAITKVIIAVLDYMIDKSRAYPSDGLDGFIGDLIQIQHDLKIDIRNVGVSTKRQKGNRT